MGCHRCYHHSQSISSGFFDGVSSLSPPLPVNTKGFFEGVSSLPPPLPVNTKRVFLMGCPGEAHGRTRPNQGPVMDERPVCLCRLPGVAPFTPPTFTRALHCAALHPVALYCHHSTLPPVTPPLFTLHSLCRPSPFIPLLFTLHSLTLHSRPTPCRP
jgi:hypothetical protein